MTGPKSRRVGLLLAFFARLFATDVPAGAAAAGRSPAQSYARTLRIISLLGGASVVSVALGVVKMKIAALFLGPIGIGTIALLQNAVGVATTLGDMGMRQSGAREISRALVTDEPTGVQRILLTLSWMGLSFALLSACLFFGLRDVVAQHLLGRPELSDDLGWSAIAVAATVIAAALTAMLNGHHRVREITGVTIYGALFSCAISVASIFLWETSAIVVFVISAPAMLTLVSLWYVAKIGALPRPAWPSARHLMLARRLLKLGVFIMLSAIVLSISELAVRLAIQRDLGMVELGLFSAAWAIGVYYLNFLMVATSTEFFPRLSASFEDVANRDHVINHQIQALCIVAAPVVIILSAFCPWILHIMYSSRFVEATSLVRLMVIGDVLRLSIYPLGFVLIAASHGRSFFALKLVEGTVFAVLAAILTPLLGLSGVGVAHIVTFTVLFGSYWAMLRVRLAFRLAFHSIAAIATLLALPISLAIVATMTETGAVLFGIGLLFIWAVVALNIWMRQRQLSGG